MRKIYEEICTRRTHEPDRMPDFPEACPACGEPRITEPHFYKGVTYACGGSYTKKPQIQNHTNKWWGACQKGGKLVARG